MGSLDHSFRLDTGAFRAARRSRLSRSAAYWLLLGLAAALVTAMLAVAATTLGGSTRAPAPAVRHVVRPVHAAAPTRRGAQLAALLPSAPTAAAPAPSSTLVAVWNGFGVPGAAGQTADRLHASGYPIAAVADAPRRRYRRTFVLYLRGAQAAAWAVARRLRLDPQLAVRPFDGHPKSLGGARVLVLLGR